MDSVSLLGPPQPSRPLNQEDFDSKFNYVKYRKKRTNCEIFKTVFVKENFRHYQKAADFLPFASWIQKYNVKSAGVRDLLGSLTMAALLLPQGIANGVLLEDLNAGLLSLILPQFIYILLGSARHCTIGSITYTSFLVYCCKYYSKADLSTLGFYCGIFQCFSAVAPCLQSHDVMLIAVLSAIAILILFRCKLHSLLSKKIGFMIPYELIVELLCFSILSLISSAFSLLPPSSSHGNSQINIESAKYSLVSNVIAAGWLTVFIYFGSPLIKYVSVLQCVVATIFMLNSYSVRENFLTLRQLCSSSCWDATLAIIALSCAFFIPNSCKGFLIVFVISIFAVALKVQMTRPQVLVRVSENHLGEEDRYEAEFLDTPVRILRLSSPIIYANCEQIRHEIYRQAGIVKGLIGIGIGSRTVSLRSTQDPKKDSLAGRSSNNLTNIVIQDCDLNQAQLSETSVATLRFIILYCSGVESIDRDGITMLAQAPKVRDAFEINGVYARIPRNVFFPTIQEALAGARVLVLPFHTSVSMNGCRDTIAFSNANSNLELHRVSPEVV
ncbi:hypothetical protein WR25_02281 [Diploscapter pachys]|uniref:STAS domain-containing protein n=1 Tax=Diploscapter pachys TaxID=2018661 RepID=A0A2A2JGN4_9BILA|nr:hypothetical protein WR25_02281 [Diploscapter pachys]